MIHTIDATNQKLGRLASKISLLLQGKLQANYNPRLAGTDKVIVKNASKITISGRKYTQKTYHRHTGYMGHLRSRTYREFFEKNPAEVLRRAVARMLPKNRLQQKRLNRFIIEK